VPTLQIQCPALGADRRIPLRNAHSRVRGGENVSLPLSWSEPPPLTRSVVVTIVDHHPIARRWIHWCVVGIPPDLDGLPEGASLHPQMLPPGVMETVNTYGEEGYGGPAPPLGSGPHEYVITVYALSGLPAFSRSLLTEVRIGELMKGMVIASGECRGLFERGK
jgi:Raf kinase inhibitor-like YbhB/YbcL family protein